MEVAICINKFLIHIATYESHCFTNFGILSSGWKTLISMSV